MDGSRRSGQLAKRREVVNTFGGLILLAVYCLTSACSGSTSFTLVFPDGVDLGELWLIEDVNCFTCGNGEEYLGRASGTYEVELPAAHWYVSLRMPEEASHLMPHLSHASLVEIGEINLNGSDIRDSDLRLLSSVKLRSVGLVATKITGDGLRHLSPHDDWIFVNLRDCLDLDPRKLAHFRGWKRSTIRVASNESWSGGYTHADSLLIDEAKHYVCDDQPEDICHTQIR